MQYCSRNSTPIQFRISSDICIKGSCGKFGRCYQFFSGGNMFSTCTCFAGKSFSSSTGCLILLCTNLDDSEKQRKERVCLKNMGIQKVLCTNFYQRATCSLHAHVLLVSLFHLLQGVSYCFVSTNIDDSEKQRKYLRGLFVNKRRLARRSGYFITYLLEDANVI